MLYELRVYHTIPDKLPALVDRFRNATLAIWAKHGIEQAGFWTTYIGESSSDLTYLLVWPDLAERQRRWDAFVADPAWRSAKEDSERGGPIVASISSTILRPTDFSALR